MDFCPKLEDNIDRGGKEVVDDVLHAGGAKAKALVLEADKKGDDDEERVFEV